MLVTTDLQKSRRSSALCLIRTARDEWTNGPPGRASSFPEDLSTSQALLEKAPQYRKRACTSYLRMSPSLQPDEGLPGPSPAQTTRVLPDTRRVPAHDGIEQRQLTTTTWKWSTSSPKEYPRCPRTRVRPNLSTAT